ncbi:MAG: cytochrome c [Balneolaceae bacterium]
MSVTRNIKVLFILSMGFMITACGGDAEKSKEPETERNLTSEVDPNDWKTNKGIGPVKLVALDEEVNMALSDEGKAIFNLKCSACHKTDKRYIGPAMQDIFERRTPEWVMNMILNPEGMVAEDPIARQLLIDFNGTPMANQNLTQEEARAVLEYFRTLKSN